MKAMVLAAGLGTRLRPLTDDCPKALVELNGRTLLEITLARLRSFTVDEVIVNIHHHADMVAEYLKERNNFGMRIELSREDTLLDTGGGLKKAAHFFLDNSVGSSADQVEPPFILHNVDVVSTIDLRRMIDLHTTNGALATLAVQGRDSKRRLLFNERDELCGRQTGSDPAEVVQDCARPRALAFAGIHVISPAMLRLLTEGGAFSIINSYLRLAAQGERIGAFRADEYYWRDVGAPESLAQAARDADKPIPASF